MRVLKDYEFSHIFEMTSDGTFKILRIKGLSFSNYRIHIQASNGEVKSIDDAYMIKVSILKFFVPSFKPTFKKAIEPLLLTEEITEFKLPEIEMKQNMTYSIKIIGLVSEPWISYMPET
jgi:hypothetical protein